VHAVPVQEQRGGRPLREVDARRRPQLPRAGVKAGEERPAGPGHLGGALGDPPVDLVKLERLRDRLGRALEQNLLAHAAALLLEQRGALQCHRCEVGDHLHGAPIVPGERPLGIERCDHQGAEHLPDLGPERARHHRRRGQRPRAGLEQLRGTLPGVETPQEQRPVALGHDLGELLEGAAERLVGEPAGGVLDLSAANRHEAHGAGGNQRAHVVDQAREGPLMEGRVVGGRGCRGVRDRGHGAVTCPLPGINHRFGRRDPPAANGWF
jgi:hypothetical protein